MKKIEYYNYRHKKKPSFKKFKLIIYILLILSLIYFILHFFNNKMLPHALSVSDMVTKTKVNEAIYSSVREVIDKNSLTSVDFYNLSKSENNKITSLTINTILINEFCNKVSLDISEKLNNIEKEEIFIPVGVITGIDFLSNYGPKYKFIITPIGSSLVDYESSFESVGINQVNFQIWLNINSEIQVINPFQNSKITITRKVPLVNTIINSDIPNNFFNTTPFKTT